MIRKYFAILAVLALVGCATDGERTDTAQTGKKGTASSSTATSGINSPMPGEGSAIGSSSSSEALTALDPSLRNNVIYFAYDSNEVSSEGLANLDAFGKYLAAKAGAKLRLEGHADERGSREYNIALGERRGIAVQSALIARGASPAQLSVISYGEERPAMPEHTEEAYAKNRRVEIILP